MYKCHSNILRVFYIIVLTSFHDADIRFTCREGEKSRKLNINHLGLNVAVQSIMLPMYKMVQNPDK